MSLLSGILNIVAGAAEIATGALIEVGTLGGGTPLAALLIGSGAGMLMSGIGTLLSDGPIKGFATTTRNPIAPWESMYGENRTGGTLVYENTWGDNDQMLDLIIVLAAHPCEPLNGFQFAEILFDQQRIQIDTTAIPTSAKAGYSIGTPVLGSGTSFTPVQQTVNISSIVRSAEGVVTVTMSQAIPFLTSGDQLQIVNVSTDATLNGIFQVAEVLNSPPTKFTFISGGTAVTIGSQGQVKTRWPNYGRNIYVEFLDGSQTLGETFWGETAGTPWQGTGKLCTPLSPQNAGGTSIQNPWTRFCSLAGKTAVFLRLQYDQKYFPQGIPQISVHMKGKNDIYDPRIGPTSDPLAYAYSTNSALCIADYLSNTTWGFKAAYGTDIPLGPLTAAATICDDSIPLALGGTESRYSCNGKFNLETKRGEVLQNLLTSCAGRLTYTEGQYVINPGIWVAPIETHVNFEAIASGAMKWHPTVSIRDLYNGVKGTYISPDNLWQSTDFPYYAQDAAHGYDPEDLLPQYGGDINVAADGGERRWLDIQLPFTISYATAQRLAKIELLRRRHVGNGTFQCNMNGYLYAPLDVILADSGFFSWSGKQLEISAVRLRSEKAGGGGWLLGTEIDVQETDSDIYVWSTSEELSPQGYVQSEWPKANVIEPDPWPWSPGYVAPISGDAYIMAPGGAAASFGIQPVYSTDASGNGIINLAIRGTAPINVLDKEIEDPLIIVSSSDSGGSIPMGEYAIAFSARDASSGYKNSNYQTIGHGSITTGSSGSISVAITYGSGDDGGDLYIGQWNTEGLYVFHHVAFVDSSTTSYTITSFNQTSPGGVDPIFDHFGVEWQQAVHTGPWAQIVSAVTTDTITFQGPLTSSMTSNQWAGYNCMLLAKESSTVEIPILYIPIASSTASAGDGTFTVTVGPNSNMDTLPSLESLLAPGDLISMCFNASFTANSMTDANIENAFYPSGASGVVEAGHVLCVLTGANAGDVVAVSSVSGGTTLTFATNFVTTPATGDLVIVCQPNNVPAVNSAQFSTSTALASTVASPSVSNLAGSVWLFTVRTEDADGNYGPDALAPYRIVYIYGVPGNLPQDPQLTLVFSGQGGNPDLLLGDTTTVGMMHTGGVLTGWDANAQEAPTGAPIYIDILRSADKGATYTTVFSGAGSGGGVLIPDGVSTLQDGQSFSGVINVKAGDMFYAKVLQIGSTSAGGRVTINLYLTTNTTS